MIVNGKAIAADIYASMRASVQHMPEQPHVTVYTCAPNFETKRYLALKKSKAEELGIAITVLEFSETTPTDEIVCSILDTVPLTDGILVQLPFPAEIDVEAVLAAVPRSHDVDGVHYAGEKTEILPPVVGAIRAIAKAYEISFTDKKVTVVGNGRLVGKPAARWAEEQGAEVTVVTKETGDIAIHTQDADVLILGAGKPHLITPDMIKEGAVIFDAGTSEENGVLRGDADPSCALRASLFTPVPGGIGPITVAVLLQNVVTLALKGQ